MGKTGDADGRETRLVFGAGRIRELSADIAGLACAQARVLLIVDPALRTAGLIQPIQNDLAAAGCDVQLNDNVAGEPTADAVDAAIVHAQDCGADIVVAVGGGSVLDVAKLVAALAAEGPGVAGYAMGARAFPARRVPVISVPTTAGTGAEVTRTCIFSVADGTKVWAWDEKLGPDLAILDPELTVTLPRALTVATGVDAMVHAMEATTNRTCGPGIDLPAMSAIGLVRNHLPRAIADPGDLTARGAMLRAACLAGLAIDRGGTGIAHAFGHALGSLAKVPHGRAVGLGLRAALRWNAESAPAQHAAVAQAFGVPCENGSSDEATSAALGDAYESFLREVALPFSLADDGLCEGDAERLAEEVMRPENAPMLSANCRAVSPDDALALSRELLSAR